MLIRQDFDLTLPPRAYLLQVADQTTKVYCYLWEKRDSKNKVKLAWDDLSRLFHKNTFNTAIRKLNNEGLLNYKERNDDYGIVVELVGWDSNNI